MAEINKVFVKVKTFFSIASEYGPYGAVKIYPRYLWYLICKYILRRETLQRRIHSYRMNLSLKTGGISKELYLFGHREDDHQAILARELMRGGKVADIGANIGYYALMEAVIVGSEGKVYAVEPDPRNIDVLSTNIALNNLDKIIVLEQAAISDKSGGNKLALHKKSNLNVMVSGALEVTNTDVVSVINVKTIGIAEFIERIGPVDLMRMDLEGYEVVIFCGIIRLAEIQFHLLPERILFEAHPSRYNSSDRNMKEAMERLFSIGYRAKTIVSADEYEAGIMREMGYRPWKVVTWKNDKGEFRQRGLYDDIAEGNAIQLLCDVGCVRAALLSKNRQG